MLTLNFKRDTLLKKSIFWLLILADIIIIGIFFVIFFATAYEKGKSELTREIIEEQQAHQKKLEELVASLPSQVEELKNDLETIKKKRILSEEEKGQLQDKLGELERVSWKLQSEYMKYDNDISIQLFPWRDRTIDDAYGRSALLPVEINRLIRSYEYVIFRGYLGKEQDEIISTNVHMVERGLDNIKRD